MVKLILATSTFILIVLFPTTLFGQKFGFEEVLRTNPEKITTFCVPRNEQNISTLKKSGTIIKYNTKNWLFISATPSWIESTQKSGSISDFYFEFAPPSLLADSARVFHFVNEIHAGTGGLNSPYTGKNVILGLVDTGIEWRHPDFKDSLGRTRVIRYWDQSMPDDINSPQPYGYGYVWDSTAINNLTITSDDAGGHGSTVTGQATGNGLANGSNKGMAPDANIVVVETDFSRSNWTLTVVDAVDFIFNIADSLNMPAVVNISLGSYFGSHDGNDPAADAIEVLLDEKPGRIVVSAAGNSGNIGNYHLRGTPNSDTNFVWFQNNPSGAIGPNTIFFDSWSDNADTTFGFAFGANDIGPTWSDRGRTNFHRATSSLGVTIFDTIWNGTNRIAVIEGYTEIVNGNYHLQILAYIDSTSYYYRFETTGSGAFDLWSGSAFGYNNMVQNAPPLSQFPDSIYYISPDAEQSIVSSWNCSEKVISVGNMRNRATFEDFNGNPYTNPDTTPPGKLSPNSSKGPNRHGIIKPNITAVGDVSLCAVPFTFLAAPANYPRIDSGGWHATNGGTSMASPVISGIAALYLERCSRATYQNFIDDLQATGYADANTGILPNNAYGYGKAHGLNTLLQETLPATPTITNDWQTSILTSSEPTGNEWYLDGVVLPGETNLTLAAIPPYGSYQVLYINMDGCTALSEPLTLYVGIEEIDNNLILTFPNPTNSILTIDYELTIEEVILIDKNGKTVSIKKMNEKKYSLENLPKGNYILKIKTDNGIYSSKITRI
tara:strand:+ start:10394 stop:12724 length:2331 start_codon:yes stop_codon:yes gene_type:complete